MPPATSSRALSDCRRVPCDAVIDIVLKGGSYCTIAAGRRWIDQGRPGTVLCVLTQSALVGAPFTTPSAMAKAGLVAMIKSLAVEWGPKGIRLVGVVPAPSRPRQPGHS